MKNLVIVESPSKSKTIEKYLGSDYIVKASMGHVRDLATTGKGGYGVDVENNFKPNYIMDKGKTKVVNELKKYAKEADRVYLASDPDREGEAIAWHLKEVLNLKDEDYDRVVFNEITEGAVKEAFNHARKIDENLVHSQESRRILDRIGGFELSKFTRRVAHGDSAGRVQSPTLKLIVDREREREAFVSVDYYEIETDFGEFKAKLEKYKDQSLDKKINSEVEAKEIISRLSNAYNIVNTSKKTETKNNVSPFTTSSLQQAAVNKLSYNSKKTMLIAQKLYEGIDIGSGPVGLITYMRTDSTRLSDVFVNETKKYIKDNYGEEYVGFVKTKKKKDDNVQDAHEAIRPTSILRTTDSIKQYLSNEEYRVYNLIYIRTLASLMAPSKIDRMSVELENNDYLFKANGHVVVFDGYLKVYSDNDNKDEVLPDFSKYNSSVIVSDKVEYSKHSTQPPARYSEATLIKELEENGIGRPSTYATVVNVNLERKYVEKVDKKYFKPTELGFIVNDKLQEGFASIINTKYTSEMEKELDFIAEGKHVWHEYLLEFYNGFMGLLEDAKTNVSKVAPKETGNICPECGSPLVIRKGKHGEFEACSNYPKCKYIVTEEREAPEETGETCPNCGSAMIFKTGRYGKFEACSNYPECKYIKQKEKEAPKELNEVCPKCGSAMVEKTGRYGKFKACSNYPKCKYIPKKEK